jgi:hypothetical protein
MGFIGQAIRGWRRGDLGEKILLSKTFRGPYQGYIWNIEPNSFLSGSGSSLLFRPDLFHDIYRANRI